MGRPRLLGVSYAAKALPVRELWQRLARDDAARCAKQARRMLKSLATFEARARGNPLAAGEPVAHNRWPRDLHRDYGRAIPNVFRFELADRWRGYFSLVGETGGVRIWVLYLWDHETYSRESGYAKK